MRSKRNGRDGGKSDEWQAIQPVQLDSGRISMAPLDSSPERAAGFSYPVDPNAGSLPAIHSKFPESQFGTPRYYTMRSLFRGRDEDRKRARGLEKVVELKPDLKEMAELKLPEVHFEAEVPEGCKSSPRKFLDLNASYVRTYKNVLKQRGLNYEDIYRRYRNRADLTANKQTLIRKKAGQFDAGPSTDEKNRKKTKRQKYRQGVEPSENGSGNGESIDSSKRTDDTCTDTTENDRDKDVSDKLFAKFEELMEEYKLTPGYMNKRVEPGRKLGNIVSSQRLYQLLENGNPIKMENFYNYYPV